MIPYEADPSLHPSQPAPPQLDDGFSPPHNDSPPAAPGPQAPAAPLLQDKSPF